jgi:hypothetical protein
LSRARLDHRHRAIEQNAKVEIDAVELQSPRFHPRQIEDVVDDREESLPRFVDCIDVVALLLTERGVEQHPGHADDGIHRLADLVAHGGEKQGLRLVRLPRRGTFLAQDGQLAPQVLEADAARVAFGGRKTARHISTISRHGFPSLDASKSGLGMIYYFVSDNCRSSAPFQPPGHHLGSSPLRLRFSSAIHPRMSFDGARIWRELNEVRTVAERRDAARWRFRDRKKPTEAPKRLCLYCTAPLSNGRAVCSDECDDGWWRIVPTVDGELWASTSTTTIRASTSASKANGHHFSGNGGGGRQRRE